MLVQLHFCAIGFGHAVCANKVYMILTPTTNQGKRMVQEAKRDGRWLDATHRRPIKSLILMDDGKLIGCAFSPKTILARLIRSTDDFTSMVPPIDDDEDEYDDDIDEEEDDDE